MNDFCVCIKENKRNETDFLFLFIEVRAFLGCVWGGGVFRRTNTVKVIADVPALLVEENLRCSSMHYFRHKRASE